MTYRKLFQFWLLICCLLGSSLATDHVESLNKQSFTYENILSDAQIFPDISTAIVSVLPLRAQLNLKQTSKWWYALIENYQPIPSWQEFTNININLHASFSKYCIFGIHSDNFYAFLPSEENRETQDITIWNQTIPWSINGNTLEAKQLSIFNSEIIDCLSTPHPNGIIVFDFKTFKHPNLLTIQNGTSFEIQPLFENFEEAKDTEKGLTVACNTSDVVFIRDNILTCYDQLYPWKNFTLNLGSDGYWFHNFGQQFLVSGSNPEKLWLINPSQNTYKEIPLPENFTLTGLTSDQDNLLASGFLNDGYGKPGSHYIIKAISSEKPTIHPLSFLPEGYDSVGLHLKNNYVFSVACLMSSKEVCEKSGVLVIYDWVRNQRCFQKYLPKHPLFADFVGTGLIIKTSGKWYVNPDYDTEDEEYIDEDLSLIGISLNNWLHD